MLLMNVFQVGERVRLKAGRHYVGYKSGETRDRDSQAAINREDWRRAVRAGKGPEKGQGTFGKEKRAQFVLFLVVKTAHEWADYAAHELHARWDIGWWRIREKTMFRLLESNFATMRRLTA